MAGLSRLGRRCFRMAASGVGDATQIHTHMCYSEFNDIIASIAAMDADVVSIETARSKMELLDAFARYRYPAEIGPGVYDIHSPRVPTDEEMAALLKAAAQRLPADQLWVNPGLRFENPQMARGQIVGREHGRCCKCSPSLCLTDTRIVGWSPTILSPEVLPRHRRRETPMSDYLVESRPTLKRWLTGERTGPLPMRSVDQKPP